MSKVVSSPFVKVIVELLTDAVTMPKRGSEEVAAYDADAIKLPEAVEIN
jgi:hypothetical protein